MTINKNVLRSIRTGITLQISDLFTCCSALSASLNPEEQDAMEGIATTLSRLNSGVIEIPPSFNDAKKIARRIATDIKESPDTALAAHQAERFNIKLLDENSECEVVN